MSATVSPEKILKDLSNLWADLAKQTDGETGVLRACSMTLVVVADASDDAQSIGQTLAQLMPEHPSRAVVVRVTPSAERALESRVFSECWTSFGERRHICAEEIEITCSAAALAEVSSVLLPLVVSDLPVVLWTRGAHVGGLPGFEGIESLATKVVHDSAAFPSARAGLERVQAALQPGRPAGDLAWTRLTRWRELIARIFQNRGLGSLAQFSEVRVAGAAAPDGKPGPAPLYIAGWLLDSLRRAGANPKLQLKTAVPSERNVRLSAPGLDIEVTQCAGHCAEVRINDMVSQTALPDASESALMAEELSIPGHDPTFERSLPAALQLALSS